MTEKDWRRNPVVINRAPVLTLWATVVAEALGFNHDQALTLGREVAGLNAYSNGVSLGLFQPTPKDVKEQRRKMRQEETVTVDLLPRVEIEGVRYQLSCFGMREGVWKLVRITCIEIAQEEMWPTERIRQQAPAISHSGSATLLALPRPECWRSG